VKPWIAIAVLLPAALALGYVVGRQHTAAPLPVPAAAPPPAPAAAADALQADRDFNADFVKTVLPQQRSIDDSIAVTGKLTLDKQRVRIAASRVAGRLGRIFVFEGQSVRAGEALAEIYSPDYISAQNEYLLARRFRDTLHQDGDPALRDDAAATEQSAANRLRVLGAADEDVARLGRSGQVEQYLVVRAPIGGVVTQRNVDPGGYLNIGDSLMTLADPAALWLYFNVYDADYPALRLGQELRFQASALPGEDFSGHVAFIAPSLDPASHTLPVRCDIPNPGLRLRPEMFVSGRLLTGRRQAWVVPRSAVFRVGEQDYLLVQDGERHYRRRAVQGRAIGSAEYAIGSGLDSAVPVVSDGAVLLNQQMSGG